MNIKQKPVFAPIKITLETPEEAEALWAAIREYKADSPLTSAFAKELSDWFSQEAHL